MLSPSRNKNNRFDAKQQLLAQTLTIGTNQWKNINKQGNPQVRNQSSSFAGQTPNNQSNSILRSKNSETKPRKCNFSIDTLEKLYQTLRLKTHSANREDPAFSQEKL